MGGPQRAVTRGSATRGLVAFWAFLTALLAVFTVLAPRDAQAQEEVCAFGFTVPYVSG